MKLRSITLFAGLWLPVSNSQLASLGNFAAAAREAYEEAGFEVQTVRLATDLFPALTASRAPDPVETVRALESACRDHGFDYLALGPARPQVSGADLAALLPELLAATERTFATLPLLAPGNAAIDAGAVGAAAQVIRAAAGIEEGFGNLRFAALANVPPGTPFFPAAYHDGGVPTFAVATQAADLALEACDSAADVNSARARFKAALEAHGERIVAVAAGLAEHSGLPFGGIDFSPAPFPAPGDSIGAALEALTGAPLGSPGTLAAAAALTDVLDHAGFLHAGFCGLMLPVLEDPVLARRSAEGRLQVGDLLQWSAVCGTGLDTVPLPGDVSEAALQRILFDVAALSLRLRKPLTARLMPLPGKRAGDPVHFDFAYFADGGVLPLPGPAEAGRFPGTGELPLHPIES